MSKHIRKILPLLLCLLLMACLLPAAYADGVEVSTLEQLQAALADQKRDIRLLNAGDVTLTGDLTVPEGVYLKVRENSRLIVPEGKTLTINGKIEASGGDGKIDVAGTMTTKMNQGEIELCNGGVLNVTGTLENNKTIFLGHNNQPDEAKPRLTIKAGAAYTGGTLTFRNNVTPNEVVEGIDLDACSFHHIQAASVTIYAPYGKENVEACLVVGRKAVDYLELRGIEEYRLSADIEIPVLDDGTVSKADMHATRLVVPDEKSVIVNGELAVKELVIENGGSVTVNGYLDAVNGITLNNGGALTVNNTHIDAGYVPTTDIEALKNIVYIGDANLLLHLVVWPSDDVPNAIRTASNAVDENVNCMVELRTDWTVDEAFDAHLITLRVCKDRTLTVNNVLTVKDLVIDDGGNVVTRDGGVISYADGVEVSTLADLQSVINSDAASCTFTGQAGGPNQGLTLTVPAGFTLNIPSGFLCLDDLTVNGTVNVTDNGMLIVDKSLTGSGAVNVAAGCLLNLPAACYDSQTHGLVSLIQNSSDNVTLVHTPANQAELRSATGKAQDAASYGFKNGFLFLQDLTISNGAIMFFNGEIISVQNNATLTISDDAVIVSDETIMVENGNIRVSNGGRLVGNVELRPGTADFTGGGYFGGETIAVTNTDNPDSCVKGLNMSQFNRKEKNGYVIFKRVSEAPEITALRNAIADPNVSGFTLAGNGPVVLTRDLIVPKGFELTVANQLVIASGAQLMMNGSNSRAFVTGGIMIAEGGSLLSVGGKINLTESGTLHISGTYTGTPGSRIEVPDADLTDIQPRVIVDYDSGEFNGPGSVMISKALLEDFSSGGVDRSQIIDTPDIGAWSDAEREDAVEYFPGKDVDPEIFQIMCIDGRFSQIRLRGTGDLTLTDNLTIPEGVYLKVRNGSTLTVPAGKTLTINGKIEASFNGVIDVVGTLQNNGQIEMFDGGVVDVKGTYSHADGKAIVFNRNGNPDAAMPKFIVEQGAVCTLNLFRTQEGLVAADVLEGINPNAYSCHSNYDRENHVVKDTRVYYPSSRAGLGGMAQRGLAYIEVHGLDTYTLSEDVEIPVFENTPAKVDMSETTLVVPSGRTLTVNGELAVKELVIESGGELLLHENGTVAVSGKLTNNGTIGMGENAQIAVSGEFVNNRLIYLRSWNGTRQLIAIEAQGKYEEHGGFDVLTQFEYERAISAIDLSDYCRLVYVTSDNNRVTRLFPGRDLSFDPNGFKQMCENGDTVYLEIRGRDTFRFESDVTIPNVMEVVANGVELVIPAGVTVTVNGKLTTRSDAKPGVSGSAQVMGVLINNGSIDLMGATDLALVNGGVYSGGGTVTRGGEPYTIWNDPANADIRLPAGLKTLESQALADGDFFAVYIPAGTESITDDAFGDKDMLIVYGVPGSKAQTFAGNNNYLFAPVAPAA